MRFISIAIIFLSLSCGKEKSCENCFGKGNVVKNATIVYAGPIETDGCGWLIMVGPSVFYHPDVLEATFHQDQLQVRITYELTTTKYVCGIGASAIPVIHVISITS